MTAASTLPFRPNARSAGICSDHRLVPLRWSGALHVRQQDGLQIHSGPAHASKPVVSRAARDAWKCSHDIGGGKGGKLLVKGHGSNRSTQTKIRNAENRACKSPQCGHNSSTMKSKYYRVTVQESGEQKLFDTKAEIKAWASKATITLQCDLTLSVLEVVEKETQFNADYATGEVEEVEA